ncbi:hypothetical protein VE02_02806 [Pseudogymnoascus sp. 03VT05]|nr:hypothetical protein VE02_02806 [Pseudogymnoascus sp. 03VT05]
MADSMCGPSNALQNFQKQSQGDRTLQQDRLSARTPQSQGFRSAGPSAHTLDPEFEAFQAGHLPLQHPEAGFHPGFQRGHTPQPGQHMNAGPGASWANDFQRLAIASPGMQQQGLPQAQHAGGWHQEFAQMNNSQAGMTQQQHSYNAPLERLSSLATTPFGIGGQPMYQTPMYQPAQQMHAEQPQQLNADVGTFDEAAFAAAFDQAAQSELQSEQASLSHALQEGHLAAAPIGADAIHHPDAPSQQHLTPAQESDDLARTAGALLTSVQGDQSDKFANSQFLQLMRQLRDKEVVVEGDAIMPASETGLGGGGADNPWLGPDGRGTAYQNASSSGRIPYPGKETSRHQGGWNGNRGAGVRQMPYMRANGRGRGGEVYPSPSAEEVHENLERVREETRRWDEERQRAPRMPYKRADGRVPDTSPFWGGEAAESVPLRTEEDRDRTLREEIQRLGPEEVERARRISEREGVRGVRERLRGVEERRRYEEGVMRELAEEEVREELAREGRSWGPS